MMQAIKPSIMTTVQRRRQCSTLARLSTYSITIECRKSFVTGSSISLFRLRCGGMSSRRSSSAASHTADRGAKAVDRMKSERGKFVSFFDGVDEIMKRESPRQYEKFLASKKSSSSSREEQRQNELYRHSAIHWEKENRLSGRSSTIHAWREKKSSFAGDSYATSEGFSTTASSLISVTSNHPSEAINGHVTKHEMQTPPPREGVFGSRINSQYDPNTANSENSSIFSTISKSTASYSSANEISPEHKQAPAISSIFDIPRPSESNGNKTDRGNKSIFSTISKSTNSLKINGPNGTSSTSILLSELFPTLYKNDEGQSASHGNGDAKKLKNTKMMYDPDQFESFHQAMIAVIDDPKMQRTMSKFEARNEGIADLVKSWLLNDEMLLEKAVVDERWRGFKDSWKDGWAFSKAVSVNNDHGDNDSAGSSTCSEKDGHEENSEFLFVLKEQQKIFQSKLLNQSISQDETDKSTKQIISDGIVKEDQANLPSSQFWQLSEILLASLGRYCARRARSSPMEVAWYKVKESGIVLSRDTISNYLHVVSTMGVDVLGLNRFGSSHKSLLSSSSTGGSGDGNGNCGVQSKTNEEDESLSNAFHIPEEVATYHDLLSRPTESSISLRVKALTSKGDARGAEELLETFKVTTLFFLFLGIRIAHTMVSIVSTHQLFANSTVRVIGIDSVRSGIERNNSPPNLPSHPEIILRIKKCGRSFISVPTNAVDPGGNLRSRKLCVAACHDC
ncbi:hypothetical protein ACHAXS_007118 [Conticribra weissflogii]